MHRIWNKAVSVFFLSSPLWCTLYESVGRRKYIQLFIKLHFKSILHTWCINIHLHNKYMIKCITVYKTRCILTCYISCYYLIMPFCINKRRGIANAEFFFNIYGFCLRISIMEFRIQIIFFFVSPIILKSFKRHTV